MGCSFGENGLPFAVTDSELDRGTKLKASWLSWREFFEAKDRRHGPVHFLVSTRPAPTVGAGAWPYH